MATNKSTPITKPKVGCSHFKSNVGIIRGENNSFISCINDIIDNIHGLSNKLGIKGICKIDILYDENANIYKLTIADNIPHGFKDIFNEGVDNPLNMGHIRTGHSDDNESSEFGTGFKKDIVYLAQFTEIYTRSVDDEGNISFIKIAFDIPEMCARLQPEESYEPTIFDIISEEQFKPNHQFEEGSTVILYNLRQTDVTFDMETGKRLTIKQFEHNFRKDISKANSALIRDEIISIVVNDIEVEPEDDLFMLVPESHQTNFTFHCDLNHKNEPVEIYREGRTEKGRQSIMKYNPRENEFKKASLNELNVIKERPSVQGLFLDSLTTKHTEFESTHQYNDLTDIVRLRRCFGSYKITKQEKDGYSNHIYHRINYKSKKLNQLIGVGSNKKVDPKSNLLMSAIHITQKEVISKFRSKKFIKLGMLDSDSEESIIVPVKPKAKPKPKSELAPKSAPIPSNLAPIPSNPAPTSSNKPESTTLPANPIFDASEDEPLKDVTQVAQPIIEEKQKVEEKPKPVLAPLSSVQKLKQMKDSIMEMEVLEKVTEIILKYVETPAINILMQYIPMDNTRIQILIDLIESKSGDKNMDIQESLLNL